MPSQTGEVSGSGVSVRVRVLFFLFLFLSFFLLLFYSQARRPDIKSLSSVAAINLDLVAKRKRTVKEGGHARARE
jgi:hypothetical protein